MNATNLSNSSFVGHYNKKIAYFLIGLGLLSLILSIINLLIGNFFLSNFFSGSVGLLGGFLYLKNPYFSYSNGELTLYSLIGIKVKKYQLDSNELFLENNKIYLQGNEKRIKIPISKFMTEEDDWQRLIALTQQR